MFPKHVGSSLSHYDIDVRVTMEDDVWDDKTLGMLFRTLFHSRALEMEVLLRPGMTLFARQKPRRHD